MKITDRSSILLVFKRLLDVGIGIYLLLIPIIIVTGGFKMDFLGISIKATHLYTPAKILVPLILIRLLITVEFKNFRNSSAPIAFFCHFDQREKSFSLKLYGFRARFLTFVRNDNRG